MARTLRSLLRPPRRPRAGRTGRRAGDARRRRPSPAQRLPSRHVQAARRRRRRPHHRQHDVRDVDDGPVHLRHHGPREPAAARQLSPSTSSSRTRTSRPTARSSGSRPARSASVRPGDATGCLNLYDVTDPSNITLIKTVTGVGAHTDRVRPRLHVVLRLRRPDRRRARPEEREGRSTDATGRVGEDQGYDVTAVSASPHDVTEVAPGYVVTASEPVRPLLAARPRTAARPRSRS